MTISGYQMAGVVEYALSAALILERVEFYHTFSRGDFTHYPSMEPYLGRPNWEEGAFGRMRLSEGVGR